MIRKSTTYILKIGANLSALNPSKPPDRLGIPSIWRSSVQFCPDWHRMILVWIGIRDWESITGTLPCQGVLLKVLSHITFDHQHFQWTLKGCIIQSHKSFQASYGPTVRPSSDLRVWRIMIYKFSQWHFLERNGSKGPAAAHNWNLIRATYMLFCQIVWLSTRSSD